MLSLLRQALALLVLPVLLSGAVGGASSVLFTCKYTKVASTACCCHTRGSESAAAELSRGSCCDITTVETALPVASVNAQLSLVGLSPFVWVQQAPAATPQPELYTHRATLPALLRNEQPRAGPSLVILHRRFLI